MKAQDNTFKEFLNADRQYEIPVFNELTLGQKIYA